MQYLNHNAELDAKYVSEAGLLGACDEQPWFAVRVRSNFERVTATSLAQRGYDPYVPEYTVKRYGRAASLPRPLLPGYVLCRLDLSHRLPLLTTPGVVGIVGVGRTPIPLGDDEVERVRMIAQSGIPSAPCPFLTCGDLVVIERGPLKGVKGILQEIKNSFTLVVSIDLLQRSVAAEIDRDWVRRSTSVGAPCYG